MEKIPTRQAYGEILKELGKENYNIVVLEADISKSTMTNIFSLEFPERFFNMGVCEQNMLGVAAGLAATNKIPFVSTYAVFASMRACEQIRTSICYPGLNVKIAVSHGGLTPGNDGPTHQAIEDMGIMRTIPNMTVLMPADAISTKKLVKQSITINGPVYIRLTRDAVPIIYSDNDDFRIGKGVLLREGKDVAIIAIGDMAYYAIQAAERLEKEGIDVCVADMHTLKPLDNDLVIKLARETRRIVTVEDHNIINGLGSAVAEVLSENIPVLLKRVGIRDTFAESGAYEDLLKKYDLYTDNIVMAAKYLLQTNEYN